MVTSVYEFNGSQTAMVSLYGIQVSGNHYVRSAGRMIRADQHPASSPVPSLERIWCLGTNRNTIPVLNHHGWAEEFADYEESEEPAVIREAQRTAETLLNGSRVPPGPTVEDYSLGVDPRALVLMGDGHWKPLSDIKIGDVVAPDRSVVSAVVDEYCRLCNSTLDGVIVSAAQLVDDEGSWVRAAHIYNRVGEPRILRHLFVGRGLFIVRAAGGTRLYRVRDYREVDSAEMQTPYDTALAEKQKSDIYHI
jgi:hypothetical protein